ncbi:hypothetical protein LWF15_09470 [Kineosporia rhizophila]|uniref:hypothetical protein n=1 Tax=Kineosporia rhizophila TaxID=84633 RepID=UPI001E3AD1FB|nr:hypothetical protein [Kineosporia rhizophila]MCE0535742.1 hypothetical protein [Kineosporia rhizophila]
MNVALMILAEDLGQRDLQADTAVSGDLVPVLLILELACAANVVLCLYQWL